MALADEVAAASGFVMGKASRVPAALVRGVPFDAATVPISEPCAHRRRTCSDRPRSC